LKLPLEGIQGQSYLKQALNMEKLKENVKVLHAFEYQDLVPGAGKY
jgi:hypothetical protein